MAKNEIVLYDPYSNALWGNVGVGEVDVNSWQLTCVLSGHVRLERVILSACV